jgi:pyruvate/2-oxoglutarate dehydrogenase complex dihydrolipoamide dehydrogenase (E3) component
LLPPALPAALCWRINHLGAYLKLREALGDAATTGPKDLLIVGAGLIGSELANDLALGGHRVTLLDVQGEPLARWHAAQAGSQVLQAWKDLPIRFVGGVKVASVERLALNAERLWHPQPAGTACAGQTTRLRITTECGQHFAADEVIVAAGLQTPSRLARSANLAWADGIAVDPHSVLLVGQELARQHHVHAVALGVGLAHDVHAEVDGAHDAVAELFVDQFLDGGAVHADDLVPAVDQRVGRHGVGSEPL